MSTPSSPAGPALDLDPLKAEARAPLRAVHTTNFPALLRQLGASLLVSTCPAGKLVMDRDDGDHLNTHSRTFQAPMGMALAGSPEAVAGRRVPSTAVAVSADPARRRGEIIQSPRWDRHTQPSSANRKVLVFRIHHLLRFYPRASAFISGQDSLRYSSSPGKRKLD